MKRLKLALVAATLCAALYGGYIAYDYATMTDQERLMLANIEALTQENKEQSNPNFVPDHYLTVEPYSTTVTCNTDGSITVAGDKFSGNYKRGKDYNILYQIKNCDGVQEGASCDQRRVGITLVSD